MTGDGRDGRDGTGPRVSEPAKDTLPIGATAGSLPEASPAPEAPRGAQHDVEQQKLKEVAAEHARFIEGDIPASQEPEA